MTNSILADRIEQFILERLGKQSSDELLYGVRMWLIFWNVPRHR